jgi:hypothetical protein
MKGSILSYYSTFDGWSLHLLRNELKLNTWKKINTNVIICENHSMYHGWSIHISPITQLMMDETCMSYRWIDTHCLKIHYKCYHLWESLRVGWMRAQKSKTEWHPSYTFIPPDDTDLRKSDGRDGRPDGRRRERRAGQIDCISHIVRSIMHSGSSQPLSLPFSSSPCFASQLGFQLHHTKPNHSDRVLQFSFL